jgi:predicted metal-dependent phosphotriesterase family hydrolase
MTQPGDHGAPIRPRPVVTVQGPVAHDSLGITDAHNHVWIGAVRGADRASPVLDDFDAIARELVEYRQAGGHSLLDCQPGGAGRDGNKLRELAGASGVNLITCTGFHRRKYYPADHKLWEASADQVSDLLSVELEQGLEETANGTTPVKAGFIKIALETTWEDCPRAAVDGAGFAAVRTGALMAVHTEKGALAERACAHLIAIGVQPRQLLLCHMDKRPDVGLHKALTAMGAMLEYDTFYRAKYEPSVRLWPLLEAMASAGLTDHIALATDMAEGEFYRNIGGGPGLASFPREIRHQLGERGFTARQQGQLLGENITRRLAGLN